MVSGAPQDIWFVTCPKCEEFLRTDPVWSSVPDSIPETPDEEKAREDRQKRTDTDTQRLMAEAVTTLPEILSQMVAGNSELVKQFLEIAKSRGTLPAEMTRPAVAGEVVSRARELPANGSDLSKLSVAQLKALAKERGIPVPVNKRDKASLIGLLSPKAA